MKESIKSIDLEKLNQSVNEIGGGVIIGICRACGGERIIEVENYKLNNILQLLAKLNTQRCNSRNPNDTWSLLEGYLWDFSHILDS